jgi:hypothetical protein
LKEQEEEEGDEWCWHTRYSRDWDCGWWLPATWDSHLQESSGQWHDSSAQWSSSSWNAPALEVTSGATASIKKVVQDWIDKKTKSETKKTLRDTSRVFPVKRIATTIDIGAWKGKLYSQVSDKGKRNWWIRGFEQFLAMFEISANCSLVDFLILLHDKKLLEEVLHLQILDSKMAWTEKMMSVLKRVVTWGKTKDGIDTDAQFSKKMGLLITEYIEPRMDARAKSKHEFNAVKDEEDLYFVLNMAPASEMKQQVEEMYKDLQTCAWAQQNEHEGLWKKMATVAMVGILYIGQVNSRPGLWAYLRKSILQQMKDRNRDYWIATEGHKQLGARGAHGAYMAPGSVKAAEVYQAMTGREDDESDDFWLYKNMDFGRLLKTACAVYLTGYAKMSPTAMRMFWENIHYHSDGKRSEAIQEQTRALNNALDHTDKVTDSNYRKGKAAKVARDLKAITIAFFSGAPFQVSSFKFQVSSFKFRVSSFKF